MRDYSTDELKDILNIYGDVLTLAGLSCYELSDIPIICSVIAEGQRVPEELRTERFGRALKRLEALAEELDNEDDSKA